MAGNAVGYACAECFSLVVCQGCRGEEWGRAVDQEGGDHVGLGDRNEGFLEKGIDLGKGPRVVIEAR